MAALGVEPKNLWVFDFDLTLTTVHTIEGDHATNYRTEAFLDEIRAGRKTLISHEALLFICAAIAAGDEVAIATFADPSDAKVTDEETYLGGKAYVQAVLKASLVSANLPSDFIDTMQIEAYRRDPLTRRACSNKLSHLSKIETHHGIAYGQKVLFDDTERNVRTDDLKTMPAGFIGIEAPDAREGRDQTKALADFWTAQRRIHFPDAAKAITETATAATTGTRPATAIGAESPKAAATVTIRTAEAAGVACLSPTAASPTPLLKTFMEATTMGGSADAIVDRPVRADLDADSAVQRPHKLRALSGHSSSTDTSDPGLLVLDVTGYNP